MAHGPNRYVARILGPDGGVVGTGTCVLGGWLLTCAHVVATALTGDKDDYDECCPAGWIAFELRRYQHREDGAMIALPEWDTGTAELAAAGWGPSLLQERAGAGDFALLRILAPSVAGGLNIACDPIANLGAIDFWATGFPSDADETGRDVSLLFPSNAWGRGDNLIVISADGDHKEAFIAPGFSGGPVFARQGGSQVLGIVKGARGDHDGPIAEAAMIPASIISWHHARLLAQGGGEEEGPSADPGMEAAPPLSLDARTKALFSDSVAQATEVEPKDLGTASDALLEDVKRKLNLLPESAEGQKMVRRLERLGRAIPRFDHLEPAQIGLYAADLIAFSRALEDHCNPELSDVVEMLATASDAVLSALRPPPDAAEHARPMASDSPWPPDTRERVREGAENMLDTIQPLHADEDHAPEAANLEEEIGYLADETESERPNWTVMNETMRSAKARVARLGGAAFKGLRSTARELAQALRSTSRLRIATLPDLAVFRDLPEAPEMVVIPAGRFLMGAPADEEGSQGDEQPQHEVIIPQRFALAKNTLTFEEYDAFCDATGREKPEDEGWGRGRRPVINVSWHDAVAYCDWLSELTGEAYRLPSEAEWEYACRAGTTTPFAFGETISTDRANYNGNYAYGSGRKGKYREKTVGVDDLDAANPWGLRHMHGNVWEWCADAWHDSYDGAPTDGSPWRDGSSEAPGRAVLRGGSWFDFPRNLRSAFSVRFGPVKWVVSSGFRPARTLFTP